MFDTPTQALTGVTQITACSLLGQTLELWLLRRTAKDDGVWQIGLIKHDFSVFPKWIAASLQRLLSYRAFLGLLCSRAACCVLLLVYPQGPFALILLVSSLLIALRWRGSFNGGSDFMGLSVLTALSVVAAFDASATAVLGGLWYISIQACNSYFLAGLVKLRSASWRQGVALPAFMEHAIYDNRLLARVLYPRSFMTRVASWSVIGLECAFPLALLHRDLCAFFVGLAFCFHFANVYVFGLNRFLWAWASTYPALLYCSGLLLRGG